MDFGNLVSETPLAEIGWLSRSYEQLLFALLPPLILEALDTSLRAPNRASASDYLRPHRRGKMVDPRTYALPSPSRFAVRYLLPTPLLSCVVSQSSIHTACLTGLIKL